MLIVFFWAALASGGLTVWLLWPQGLVVALVAAAVVASVAVAALAVVSAVVRSRIPAAEPGRPRGILDALGPRPPR